MSAGSASSNVVPGTLYVVATPIGNLGDLSTRAREVLAGVDVIAAEDTRHTRQLLEACGLSAALTSLHEHNEARRSEELIGQLSEGRSVALVSDAGTPLISDPGFDLVAKARARGITVLAIPGPCAAVAALSIAGLPTDRFVFEGFLPAREAARRARLVSLADSEERTLVFYESPHRLAECLSDMAEAFGGERRACVGRELTKRFETTYDGTLTALSERAQQDSTMARGEIVIVVAGREKAAHATSLGSEEVLRALLDELGPSRAAKIAARLTGANRSELYEAALRLGGKEPG